MHVQSALKRRLLVLRHNVDYIVWSYGTIVGILGCFICTCTVLLTDLLGRAGSATFIVTAHAQTKLCDINVN